MQTQDYHPINEYGLIGDLHTAALVHSTGSIDWLCLPYFDSSSLFAKILDTKKGGSFQICPAQFESSYPKYLPKTNILQTTFRGPRSEIQLTDFMPIQNMDGTKEHLDDVFVCRQVECTKGTNVEIKITFDPQPEYATDQAALQFQKSLVTCDNYPLQLVSDHPIEWQPQSRRGSLYLSHGDIAHFIFYFGKRTLLFDPQDWVDFQFTQTRHYWEGWTAKNRYKGRWRRAVERSALTLKLMVFQPTGAIIAAPTASLPEALGGERNWDYRFSWIRDSALTLEALFSLGYAEEAEAYMSWILEKTFPSSNHNHILYPISDRDTTEEKTLDHLSGYRGSQPVRIGNAAAKQFQLDVYGELLDTIYQYAAFKGDIHERYGTYVEILAEHICDKWNKVDEGIWEVRGGPQHFTHSKVMCWIGLDRAIRLAYANGYRCDVKKWRAEKDKLFEFITKECVHPKEKYFTQSSVSQVPDASLLLLPIQAFLPPEDPLIKNTVEKILKQLTKNKLVHRYLNEDGLVGQEGSFNICTFWMIEALALFNRTDEAMDYFNHMLEMASYLGLYAEETDPKTLEALGNFPQAFTHIGLIHAALAMNQKLKNQDLQGRDLSRL